MDPITSIVASMLISGAAASDGHGCAERPHDSLEPCACTRVVDFYTVSTGGAGGYTPPGGWGPLINVPSGPAIHVASPGYRVVARPVNVAGPEIHIDGPPVYVDAPPIRIAPAQIYVQRPDVHVRPSEIMVEPPEVYFSDCPDGTVCTPIDGNSGGGMAAYASTPSPVPVHTPAHSASGERLPAYAGAPSPAPEVVAPPAPVYTPIDGGSEVRVPTYEANPLPEVVTPPSSTRVPPAVPFYPPKQDRN